MPEISSAEKKDDSFTVGEGAVAALIVIAIISAVIGLMMWGIPRYWVYSARLSGQSEFERAEQNRKIKVEEAKATLAAAQLLNQAEVERARGVAEANKIIADGLGGPEGYLRYLYIQMLEETGKGGARETVYVPTEAGIPILEAGRAAQRPNTGAPR